MKDKPIKGQIVKLNDYGMNQIRGLTSAEMVKQSQRMVITSVWPVSLTGDDVGSWPIEVNQPLITQFCIDNHCVDLI